MQQEFNSSLLRLSCHRLFQLNSQSFDGSSLIKRFGEYHALLLTIQGRQQARIAAGSQENLFDYGQRLQIGLNEGLVATYPQLNEQKRIDIVNRAAGLIEALLTKQIMTTKFNTEYLQLCKMAH